MDSGDLIVIEGRAERAAEPRPEARDNSFEADRTFQNHAREDVLALVAAVREAADGAEQHKAALTHAALALMNYAELYGELDRSTIIAFSIAKMLGYRGPLELRPAREWLREQVR